MDFHNRNAMAGLPDEAMLEILARTPFRSVCRSKCVAKAWRDLIEDPFNRRRLPQTLQGFFSFYRTCDSDDDSCDLEHSFIKYLASLVPLDIDPCLSFLMKQPETESVEFLDSCNGLLLLKHYPKSNPAVVLSYIVCNPATKHWATVPVCTHCPPPEAQPVTATYLAIDPARAMSPHFHLIQFWKGDWDEKALLTYEELTLSVHTYSSETRVWSHSQTDCNELGQLEGWRRQGRLNCWCNQRTFVNGFLHLVVSGLDRYQIAVVDLQGKTKRIITAPDAADGRQWHMTPYISQSQGRLHYINQVFDAHESRQAESLELSIWELQDYDTQEWVLKDTVSFLQLFGRTKARRVDFYFVTNHPDLNVVLFVDPLKRLIAYDMDSKEVTVFMSNENLLGEIVPYIPYFSESPTLTNKD